MSKKKDGEKQVRKAELKRLRDKLGVPKSIDIIHEDDPKSAGKEVGFFIFQSVYPRMAAAAIVAAVNYMDQDFLEDNPGADDAAFRFFRKVASANAEVLQNRLATEGVITAPEVWANNYRQLCALLGIDLEDDDGELEAG